VRRRLRIAGGVVERLVIDLVEAATPGILRIEAAVPDVVVEVDGEAVGTTPFDGTVTLSVGEHRVVARRRGYQNFERTLHMDRGSEAELVIEMQRDELAADGELGALLLALPSARYEARIDGEPVGLGTLRSLPVGRHRLELDVEERLPYSEIVDIRGGDTTELRPELEWTPTARDALASGAHTRRWLGVGLTLGGAAVLGSGLGVMFWNLGRIEETNRQATEINELLMTCEATGSCDPVRVRANELVAERDAEAIVEGVTWGMVILGAASTVTGLILWLTAPSEERIDASASASVDFVPLPGGGFLSARMAL
jgi:hypothetical protein